MAEIQKIKEGMTGQQVADLLDSNFKALNEEIGSGGGSITVDDSLSGSSTNPVQNKVIKAELDKKSAKTEVNAAINEAKSELNSDISVLQSSVGTLQTKVSALSGIDSPFVGYFDSAGKLPARTEPAWALVGDLATAKPYAYYVAGNVPNGYSAGWNDLSGALGTYDFTDLEGYLPVKDSDSDNLAEFVDRNGNLLFYVDADGNFHAKQKSQVLDSASDHIIDFTDENGNLLFYVDKNGKFRANQDTLVQYSTSNHLVDFTDEKGNLLFYVDNGGVFHAKLSGELSGEKRDVPENATVLNAYKKAKQLELIKWTPKATVVNNLSGYPGNTEITGLPYSSVKEIDTYIPYDVSFHTFMTAVNNPGSLLYTENIAAGNTGIQEYHGTNAHTYFGCVCNIFALWPLGCRIPYNSYELERHPELFEKLYDQSHGSIRLMDLIWEPGHCNLITDIYRDARGNITKIYWSEATQYTPTTTVYTPEQFDERIKSRGGVIFRYKELYQNTGYERIPYVQVENEPAMTVTYNNDICTFKGDRACFVEGDTIRVNYTKGSYSYLELYKDGSLLDTLALDDSNVIDLTDKGLLHGMYKARLKNGDKYSDYTYFQIVDVEVSCTAENDSYRISFGSDSSKPIYYEFCYINGKTFDCIPLSEEDIELGSTLGTVTEEVTENLYVKVHFQAEYGRVRNKLVLVKQF